MEQPQTLSRTSSYRKTGASEGSEGCAVGQASQSDCKPTGVCSKGRPYATTNGLQVHLKQSD